MDLKRKKRSPPFNCFTFWFALALSPCIFGYHEDLPQLKGKAITGIYYEESPSVPLVYEKIVPLLFEFRVRPDLWSGPTIMSLNKLKILPRLNCRSDNKSTMVNSADWFFTCPVFYHVNDFLKQFKTNYTDIHPAFRPAIKQITSTISQEYQRFSHHSDLKFEDCEYLISRSWKGIYNGRDIGLGEYKILLSKCNSLPNYFEEQISDYNYDSTYLFDNMRDNFMSNFFLNTSNPDPGEMIGSLLGIQGLHLINTVSEMERLRELLQSCQNQMIPYSFLKGARLEKALQDVKMKLLPLKYSFPSGLTITKLLKLPLADCIFTPTTVSIQILLPVISEAKSFNLLKFRYPQYLYRNQLCSVRSVEDVRGENQPSHFLFDRVSKTLAETPQHHSSSDTGLRFLPSLSERGMLNRCIFDLLNASFEAIKVKENCYLKCDTVSMEYSKKVLPLIQRVSQTKFVIAVNRLTSILIKCDGKPDEMITPQQFGAVEVTLPCNCFIMYHDEKFYSRPPCGNSLFIQHVIPEHMLNSTWESSKYLLDNPNEVVNISLIDLDKAPNSPDAVTLNTTAEAAPRTTSSVEVGQADLNACYRGHLYLWGFILIQSLTFSVVVLILLRKVNTFIKASEYARQASVSFNNVSQITSLDDK